MYSQLKAKLQKGEIIILDGGIGSELERRGVPTNIAAWVGAAVKTHPDTLRQVHQDYITAGADIITANTFPANRHSLLHHGMGDLVWEINTRSVAIAQEARENAKINRDVFIAGAISNSNPYHNPTISQKAGSDYSEQASILAESGVDLIMMEMMKDLEQSALAIKAALSTGLPTWVGFTCQQNIDTSEIFLRHHPEIPFVQALELLISKNDLKDTVISVMHTNVDDTEPALRILKENWGGPIGAYPNSGWFKRPNWQFENIISPRNLATEAKKWVHMGVQIIGGCCGVGPGHIRILKETLPTHISLGGN